MPAAQFALVELGQVDVLGQQGALALVLEINALVIAAAATAR